VKTIICGGRDYVLTRGDARWLDELRATLPITGVVSGGATGADAGGEKWARARGVPVDPKPAKWDDIDAPGAVIRTRRDGTKYNVLAGHWRNQEMAECAEACIAFPGETGTADMLERADKRGLKIILSPKRSAI
jgi:predicted Rossmann-fold nucleotide-binding protein